MRLLALFVLLCACPLGPALAEGEGPQHALALHGPPKYPADFEHFDYVNPEAPKGGEVRLADIGSFDSFNPYIIKGVAAPGLGRVFETLMVSSDDEPFTMYGLIAESIETPPDRSWVIFDLRAEARWHDGRPITADDVIFTFETLREKGHPFYRAYYGSVAGVERLGERRVKFAFVEGENRELPLIVGQLPVLPQHWWRERDFTRTTLEPPLGSGPYRIAEFEPGRRVTYERVPDYWGKDLAVNRGRYNFDRVRFETFLDPTVVREAVKGGVIDYHVENQAKAWAVDFDVPAVRQGWLVKAEIAHERPTGMQAWVFNTRRPIFADRRVREALSLAFDFEWTNRNLFFGQYSRTASYFSNSELASEGLPDARELELLLPYRDRLPEEVFTKVYAPLATDGSGWPRENLLRALALLAEAGWEVEDLKLVNRTTGEPLQFEILIVSPAFERIALPFVHNLRRLGIAPSIRLVDASQYINRVRDFDFDMIVGSWGQSRSPGNEQRDFWSSAAAEAPGSRNYAGIKDPLVDELIEKLIAAPSREDLVARCRALDRVLLWNHYVIPQWHSRVDRLLYWDKYARPEITSDNGPDLDNWWFVPEKADELARRVRVAEQQKGQP